MVGKIEERRLLKFELPVPVFALLSDAEAQHRRAKGVAVLKAGRGEPVPVLDTRTPVGGEDELVWIRQWRVRRFLGETRAR